MDRTAKRTGGLLEGAYRLLMRRNSVYVTFIVAGAFLGERMVDYGVNKIWEYNNTGKDTRIFQSWGRGLLRNKSIFFSCNTSLAGYLKQSSFFNKFGAITALLFISFGF